MITPFSITELPRDLMKPILLQITDSLVTLKVYQQVSKGFKSVVDDVSFLNSLLVKFKGSSFSESIYTSVPRKFLLLDRDMTIVFQTIVSKKEDFNEITKKILKTTSSIALQDLNLRLFTITNEETTTYFRISKAQVDDLEKVDITNQEEWKKCIENMATCMTEHKFPIQVMINFPDNIPYLKKIESTFLSPNEKMQKLIIDYEITDVFFGEPSDLVVHAHKGKELNHSMFEDAVLDPEYSRFLSTCQLLHGVPEEVNLTVIDGDIVFELNEKFQEIRTRLKELKPKQKEALEQFFSSDFHKFLFGMIFSEIWPNNLKNLGDEKCNDSFNYLLVKVFAKSIQVVCREEEKGKADLKFDPILKNFMLNRLKDSTSGLKACMEEKYGGQILSLCQNMIFSEIWNEQPFDRTKAFLLESNQK